MKEFIMPGTWVFLNLLLQRKLGFYFSMTSQGETNIEIIAFLMG